jgi:hypothetical protein
MSGDNEIGLHQEQIDELTAPTPKESILSRPSPWGGEIDYVTGEYVKRRLMSVFRGAMRVTVRNIEVVEDCILTHITLEYPIIQFCNNGTFVNEEWARIDEVGVSTIRSQGSGTNYATAVKASHTDALKRAATHLGIGLDLYEKTSVLETKMEDQSSPVPDWVAAAQASNQPAAGPAPAKPSYKAPSSFTNDGGNPASGKQVGYIKVLAKKCNSNWSTEWLHLITGVPQEKFEGDMSSLSRVEATSVIDILKEMNDNMNGD